jgi:hypothetical protein
LLAVPKTRSDNPISIEFPIFLKRFNKNGTPTLEGKIEFIASKNAKKIIEEVQPYNGIDPLNDKLWIIHDLDRKAKHRELPMLMTGFDLGGPQLNALALLYAADPNHPPPADLARQLKENLRVSPLVIFRDFIEGKPSPVIPSLVQLEGEARHVIGRLEGEL